MALRISTTSNQYSLKIPAHRFRQGGREVYYFALDFPTLDGLLPQRVEGDVVRDANRRLNPSHAKNIQVYLAQKDDWLLGALMLGISPDAVEFEPYLAEKGDSSNPNFGELRILTNRLNTMRIFDGQHRRRAILDVLAELSNARDNRSADKLEALHKASMTIVLYAESDIKTLRQMFVDASKTKRIESHTVTRFDRRDAFNLTAVRLADHSRLFKLRVERERSTVAASSCNLLSINQLATVLKSLEVGYGRRVSRGRNDEFMQDLDALYERCRVWSDEFMPAAREEYSGLVSGEIMDADIPQIRARKFAYSVAFMRLLAGCYSQWTREYSSWKPLAEYVRKSSIRLRDEHGLLASAGLVAPDGVTLYARRQEMARAIDYIVREARTLVRVEEK